MFARNTNGQSQNWLGYGRMAGPNGLSWRVARAVFGGSLLAMSQRPSRSKGNLNWYGGTASRFRMSCLIRQPLAWRAFEGHLLALHVVNAELGAGVHSEVKFCQIAVEMFGVDVLVNANDAALEDREKPFKRIGMHVAALPLKFGMVNRAMAGCAGKLEHRGAIRHQAALRVELRIEKATDTAMVDDHRADRAAAFNEAQNLYIALATSGPTAGLGRLTHFHVVGLDRLAGAANWAAFVWRHHFADAVAKVPSGFHAAAEHPLKLARRNTFLRRAKQVDGLQPHFQGKVAILENRALAHGKGGATAGVALAQPDLHDAFGVLLAGLGAHALQPPDLIAECSAMRANRAIRPNLRFDVLESGFFAKEPRIGKDGLGHGNLH